MLPATLHIRNVQREPQRDIFASSQPGRRIEFDLHAVYSPGAFSVGTKRLGLDGIAAHHQIELRDIRRLAGRAVIGIQPVMTSVREGVRDTEDIARRGFGMNMREFGEVFRDHDQVNRLLVDLFVELDRLTPGVPEHKVKVVG